MKEVIALIRPDKLQATREAADTLGAEETMHWRVLGRGHQNGLRYLRPTTGGEEGGMQFLPKWMAGWVIDSPKVEELVAAIIEANRTNNYGDGQVFVCDIGDVCVAGGPRPVSQGKA